MQEIMVIPRMEIEIESTEKSCVQLQNLQYSWYRLIGTQQTFHW